MVANLRQILVAQCGKYVMASRNTFLGPVMIFFIASLCKGFEKLAPVKQCNNVQFAIYNNFFLEYFNFYKKMQNFV